MFWYDYYILKWWKNSTAIFYFLSQKISTADELSAGFH